MSYPNYVFSIFAFIGFLLAIIPLPWHLEAWNVGTCLFMVWIAAGCLIQFVNSIIWNGNTINHAPVWCDIATQIMNGANMALPAGSLCITRRLYHISRLKTVRITKSEKRRQIIVDAAILLGLPILYMLLAYISQGHRFDIYEDIGCVPTAYLSPVAIALGGVPPLLIVCATAVYSILTIRAFYKRRRHLQALLSDHGTMNTNRYIRLMCVAGVAMLVTIPLVSSSLSVKVSNIQPWISWKDTHWHFSNINIYPANVWRRNSTSEGRMEVNRWVFIIPSVIFFAFFGFAEEARHNYRVAFWRVVGWLGYARKPLVTPNGETKHFEGPTNIPPIEGALGEKETVVPAKGWTSRLFSFLAASLHLPRKQPLLPIQFARQIFTSQGSYFSPSSSNFENGPQSRYELQISIGEVEAGTLNNNH